MLEVQNTVAVEAAPRLVGLVEVLPHTQIAPVVIKKAQALAYRNTPLIIRPQVLPLYMRKIHRKFFLIHR